MLRSLLTGAAVVTTVLALAACQSEKNESAATQPEMGALNDTCPISGNPVDPSANSAEYAGYKIGFCCNGCPGGWDKKSDAEKKAAVAKYTK